MSIDQPQKAVPSRRLVLLGASNLVRGISAVVGISRQMWTHPVDVLAALGHGRSYGLRETRVLMRGLPGILQCGIWKALSERTQIPTTALVTDIGNDILYGVPTAQIASWVETCLRRLSAVSERIVITGLPIDSIAGLGPKKFTILRSILFPASRLRLDQAIQRSRELNEQVLEIAERYNSVHLLPRNEWYRADPIHISFSESSAAWQEIISACCDEPAPIEYSMSFSRWVRLRCLRPQQRRLFGFVQQQSQPSGYFPDGTRVSFF